MQPHHPFIKSKKINKIINKIREEYNKKGKTIDPWHLAKDGLISEKELWEAYKRNLVYALPYAVELAKWFKNEYEETTVITSDHGNAFKKKFGFWIVGHPYGFYINDLMEVPWCVIKPNSKQNE